MLRTRSLGPADNRETGKREAGLRHREQLVALPRSFRQIANAISGIISEEPLDRPRSSPSAGKQKERPRRKPRSIFDSLFRATLS